MADDLTEDQLRDRARKGPLRPKSADDSAGLVIESIETPATPAAAPRNPALPQFRFGMGTPPPDFPKDRRHAGPQSMDTQDVDYSQAAGMLIANLIPGAGPEAGLVMKFLRGPGARLGTGTAAAIGTEYAKTRDWQQALEAGKRFAISQGAAELVIGGVGAARNVHASNKAAAGFPASVKANQSEQARGLAKQLQKLVPGWKGLSANEQGLFAMLQGPQGRARLDKAYADALLKGNPRPAGVSDAQIIQSLGGSGIDTEAQAAYARGLAMIKFAERGKILGKNPDGSVYFRPDRVQRALGDEQAVSGLRSQPGLYDVVEKIKVPKDLVSPLDRPGQHPTARPIIPPAAAKIAGSALGGAAGVAAAHGLGLPHPYLGYGVGAAGGGALGLGIGSIPFNRGVPAPPMPDILRGRVPAAVGGMLSRLGAPSPTTGGPLAPAGESPRPDLESVSLDDQAAPRQEAAPVVRPLPGRPYNPETATASERDAQLDWLRKNDRGPLGNVLRSLPDRPQPPLTELQPEFGR